MSITTALAYYTMVVKSFIIQSLGGQFNQHLYAQLFTKLFMAILPYCDKLECLPRSLLSSILGKKFRARLGFFSYSGVLYGTEVESPKASVFVTSTQA
jgi:hypothetical protein